MYGFSWGVIFFISAREGPPHDLRVEPQGQRSANVEWKKPETTDQQPVGYELYYIKADVKIWEDDLASIGDWFVSLSFSFFLWIVLLNQFSFSLQQMPVLPWMWYMPLLFSTFMQEQFSLKASFAADLSRYDNICAGYSALVQWRKTPK